MKTYNRSSEDYLEAILLLSDEVEFVHRIDIARKLGVSQPAVQKAINLPTEGGSTPPAGMPISPPQAGKKYASSGYDRHCVIRTFLMLHGVNRADADSDACEMEHVVSQATFDMMRTYVSEHGASNGN